MEQELLISHPRDSIFQITLNRPRQLNALSDSLINQLQEAIEKFKGSRDSVMILTGNGRAFCFGADFLEFQQPEKLPQLLKNFQSLILQLYECPGVTIAALNGFATGAGLDLALACDFRIASSRVKVSEAYIQMGLVCDGGGSFFLPRLLGSSRALRMLMTGESLTAEQAHSLGLVDFICPPEELLQKTIDFAADLASKPQTALRLMKKLIRENSGKDLATVLTGEADAQMKCFQDADHQKILKQFLQKKRND